MTLTQKKQRSGAISGIGCGMTKCDTNVVCNMERQRVEFPRIKAVTVPQNGKNRKTQATKRLPRPFLTSLITLVLQTLITTDWAGEWKGIIILLWKKKKGTFSRQWVDLWRSEQNLRVNNFILQYEPSVTSYYNKTGHSCFYLFHPRLHFQTRCLMLNITMNNRQFQRFFIHYQTDT